MAGIFLQFKSMRMIHDLKKRGVHDTIRINVQDYFEVLEWSEKFKVMPETLLEAIATVGPTINNVREYLHRKGHIVAS
jgi:hypothetical protein